MDDGDQDDLCLQIMSQIIQTTTALSERWTLYCLAAIFRNHLGKRIKHVLPSSLSSSVSVSSFSQDWFYHFLKRQNVKDNVALLFDLIDGYVRNCLSVLEERNLDGHTIYQPIRPNYMQSDNGLLLGYYLLRFNVEAKGSQSFFYPFYMLYQFPWPEIVSTIQSCGDVSCRVLGLINSLIPNVFDVSNQLRLLALEPRHVER